MSCSCFGASATKTKKGFSGQANNGIDENLLESIRHFSYNEIKSATNNFHVSNKLGRGGFGTVYKGTLRDGVVVAVKALSAQSKQGVHEFLTEIKTISNVRHFHLVELIGCCVDGGNRILVYEYVENNSLERALLSSRGTNIKLDWSKRGYLAPEYALGGQLTLKADVYSFGVLILEIVSGRNNSNNWGGSQPKLLVEWAWQLHEEGKLLEIVDSELTDFSEEEVTRYMKVAFFCTQATANRRPLMSQVVDMLSRNIRINDKQLTAPGSFQDSKLRGSSSKNTASTSQEMSSVPVTITQVTPR
ncbi:hypothetical protein F8388_000476 [Cannabis sativa]|uniref:Protein kinase domain-containing protein n=1 Tax=Cannabis sativa TaxID=3483 RepID=A0A7J6HGN7_CANSA|nr:hypothetical protein F8388_000476 [Cannabis sativa]KAF4394061.1 hypothetical protein G4B88_026030 [Cannabis sativa]